MATNNEHKLREIRQILNGLYEVRGLCDIGCHEDIPETAGTLEGNALQKARYIAQHYGLDCFADDTGLEVDALGGEPGVYTARYGQMNGYGDSHDAEANIHCLLDRLKNETNRHARFRTVIALVRGGEEHLFEGVVEGEILRQKTGTDGFGYDPIFAPTEAGMSFAEMGPQEKNRISHRGRATRRLVEFLQGTLALVLILALSLCPLLSAPAHAQQIGEWQVYPSYQIARQCVAVGNMVYVLTSAQEQLYNDPWQTYNLMRYDNEDASVKTYNSLEDLNDLQISHMGYSAEAKRLILVYKNGNIDLLDLDDNVLNIASLKESTLSGKTVNCLYVSGRMAYLGTQFGFITVDMAEGVISETYRLGINVQSLAVVGGTVYLGQNGRMYTSTDADLHLPDSWQAVDSYFNARQMVVFDGNLYLYDGSQVAIWKGTWAQTVPNSQGSRYLTVSGGRLMFDTGNTLYVYTSSADVQQIQHEGTWDHVAYGGSTFWAAMGNGGLHGFRAADGLMAETVGRIQPNSPMRTMAYRMQYEGNRLLVAGGINTPYAINYPVTAMHLEGDTWTNFDEEGYAQQYPDLRHRNATHLVQDPADSTHHYLGTQSTGLLEYRNGKFVALYNSDNSPLRQIVLDGKEMGLNYVGCMGLKYDTDGNLWMMNQQTDTIIRILQPSGRWLSLYYDEISGIETPDDYLFTTSGVRFLVSRRMDGRGFFGFHTNGTLGTVRDDKHLLRTTLVNQDGTSYTPDQFYCMTEDLDGRVWCGTLAGLFVINDPTTFFNSDFQFEQIKIARNDGSGLADYLLSGLAVTCIAVDGANRKWVGTGSNGLYLVSADGQELIHHFTTADSPLLSDNIQCLAIHPITGVVMIGTDLGLCSYVSDATEAEAQLDKDNVVVYPNPVRPDYTGPIVVRGLTMDGEVKICSATGQLVWNGVSNGGTLTWDGRNKHGKRVASGVYHVVANTADGKKAVVSRIIVIR